MSFLVLRSFCFLQKIFLFFSLLMFFFLKWRTPISFRRTEISAKSLLFYYKRGDISPQKQFFWTAKGVSWQGKVVKIGFYGESEGQEEAFKLKRRGRTLKRKAQSACFVRTDKKKKRRRRNKKSMGRLIAFYEMEKREKQGKKLDYDWTQEN